MPQLYKSMVELSDEQTKERLICSLLAKIEEVSGRKMQTPRDFDLLSASIYHSTNNLINPSTLKRIFGYKNYVSVDGGMSDNPRYALYHAPYTCLLADRVQAQPGMVCSVVGRCCESGDIIQEHVSLPADVRRGDILAVCTTGAYNYSMASNYNRLPRPAIVMLREGKNYLAVRRESFADLCRNEL